jgi:hypothetical protein
MKNLKNQKTRIGLLSAAVLALSLVPSFASAQELENVQSNGNLHLSGYGSFFLDGSTVFVDGKYLTGSTAAGRPGNFMTGQMYVQFMKPQAQNGKKHVPIVFVQGCCLTAKSWQTTPDGRMGWDEYFVRQGFDTYLVDQVARARSGFNPLQYQKVLHLDAPPETNPNILVGTDNFAWSGFRWGDFTTKTPHPGIRFPMNTVGVGPGSNLSFYDQILAL